MLRKIGGARLTNCCEEPRYETRSRMASGINTVLDSPPTIDMLLSSDFEVAPGIRATLKEVIVDPNFGVITVVPTGDGALIDGVMAHEGLSVAFGIDISNLLPRRRWSAPAGSCGCSRAARLLWMSLASTEASAHTKVGPAHATLTAPPMAKRTLHASRMPSPHQPRTWPSSGEAALQDNTMADIKFAAEYGQAVNARAATAPCRA